MNKSFGLLLTTVCALAGSTAAQAQLTYEPYKVVTLAGSPPRIGGSGSADGTGNAARFNFPTGVAFDNSGNVYVADTYNNTVRKINPAGLVTTLAGSAGEFGSADGIGTAAGFSGPQAVAVDGSGNVYVTDFSNSTIRKITPAGVV